MRFWKGVAASAATFALAFGVLSALNGPEPSGAVELRLPSDARAVRADRHTELGTRALKLHDFQGGLRHGREALRLAPDSVRPLSVIVDAQVELGRYDDAARALQTLVDRKPHLAAYARVSYFRELHGDVDGAVEAMRLAASASGSSPEDAAYVQALLGQLEFDRGRTRAAERAYLTALARRPGHAGALEGLARIDAARGRMDEAIRTQARVASRPQAIPETIIALGELQLAAGDRVAGRRTMARARQVLRDEAIRGTANANERALIEAEHGDPDVAVQLGRRGWSHAPSIVSADALGWAYTRAGHPNQGLRWARRALATGSRDRLLLYHAGIAARDAGRPALARRWLSAAVEGNPRFSALHGVRAQRALAALR